MRDVFLFGGQSNASGYSQAIILQGSGRNPNFDSNFPVHSSAPYYVPDYARTPENEWSGSPAASIDTGRAYPYPFTADGFVCPINYTVNVTTTTDDWTAIEQINSFALEFTFIARHLATFPATPVAIVKCSMGGSQLAGDWLPAHTGSNTSDTDRYLWPVLRAQVQQAAARLDAAGEPWRWAGFVWMQGESGAHSGSSDDSQYLSDARAFFAAVRTLTDRADLPVLIGEIGDNWGWLSSSSGDTANANPALRSFGAPYAAVDASIVAGTLTVTQPLRDSYVASAYLRRLTQRTLGADANCTSWNNDGYPCRPPYDPAVAAYVAAYNLANPGAPISNPNNDSSAYHWSAPGNLAAGERAFNAYAARWGGRTRVSVRRGRFRARAVPAA